MSNCGQTNFARVSLERKTALYRLYIGKTSYKNLEFARSEFSRLVGPPNEYIRLMLRYYVVKYSFGIKTTLVESLRSQESRLKARVKEN